MNLTTNSSVDGSGWRFLVGKFKVIELMMIAPGKYFNVSH
jgi:hypothetical protein